MLYILDSHKGVKCEFLCQSGWNGRFSIAAFLLRRRKHTDSKLSLSEADQLVEEMNDWVGHIDGIPLPMPAYSECLHCLVPRDVQTSGC